MLKPYIIGITGGSASGKTRFLKELREAFSVEQVCFISQDEYYKEKHLQPIDDKGIENFDTPDSIDFQAFLTDLRQLKAGRRVDKKQYTFNNPSAIPKIFTYLPTPVIIVEGIFVLHYPELVSELDLKVYLDAKEIVRLKRRIIRDKEERGYDLEDVLYRLEYHVTPTFQKYIEPSKEEADIIIPNNKHFKNALELLKVFIKSKIND